jgi:DNA-binding transcriptional LysR family regulator
VVELMARTDAVMAMPAPVFAGPLSLSRGLLVEIPLEEPLPPFILGLCTRTETQMTSLATAFARAVADLARRLPQAR